MMGKTVYAPYAIQIHDISCYIERNRMEEGFVPKVTSNKRW